MDHLCCVGSPSAGSLGRGDWWEERSLSQRRPALSFPIRPSQFRLGLPAPILSPRAWPLSSLTGPIFRVPLPDPIPLNIVRREKGERVLSWIFWKSVRDESEWLDFEWGLLLITREDIEGCPRQRATGYNAQISWVRIQGSRRGEGLHR